jgi:CRP/FNR family transcriptional regulator, cyclic AMP receptor protein
MPASVLHSATEAYNAISAILTGVTDRSAIGFIASGLVLATFGMKDMINLRIVAICSNIAFIVYGFVLDLPPILILHVMLLPLNGWRLMGVLKQRSATRAGQASVTLQPFDFIAD